jgi:hypothetical protein
MNPLLGPELSIMTEVNVREKFPNVCSIMRGRQVIGVENSLIFPGIFRNLRGREREYV